MLWSSIVLLTSFCGQPLVSGWTYPKNSRSLPEGSACNTMDGTGICTLIQHCQSFLSKKVAYTNLKRCSFKGRDEITCCPISFDVRQDIESFEPSSTPRVQRRSAIFSQRFPDSRHTSNHQVGKVCHLSSGTGACTPISQCEALIRKAVAYRELTRCSFLGIEEVVCCPSTTPPISLPTRPPTFAPPRTDIIRPALVRKRPSEVACESYKSGATSRRLTYYILNGVAASPGEFAHVGAMLYASEMSGTKYELRCGASLISARFALTVAHCVKSDWPVLVRFGSIEWDPTIDAIYRFDARVKDVIQHEDYVSYLTYHDIALIEFTKDVSFNSLVYPACLQSANEDLSPSIDLTVAGWGSTDGSVYSKSFSLMSTNQRTVALNSCNGTLAESGFRQQYIRGLDAGQYCATDPTGLSNKDACYGASGGPLMKEVDEKIWQVVGLVSFGNGCGENQPSVYTRVSYYLDWIESKVWPKEKRSA